MGNSYSKFGSFQILWEFNIPDRTNEIQNIVRVLENVMSIIKGDNIITEVS